MILVLYGSQTGNSSYLAGLIEKVIKLGYNAESLYNKVCISTEIEYPASTNIKCMEMDDFHFESILNINFIIFVCSTHGDGDEPFNMRKFWNFLKFKGLPRNFLSHLRFSVYGLGDSSYPKFNYCAKMLHNRLLSLGAVQILPLMNGDSQDLEGYMTTFKPWIKNLYEIIKDEAEKNIFQTPEIYKQKGVLYKGIVTERVELTPKKYQLPVVKVNFNIEEYKNFYPGDCIGILPENYNFNDFLNHNQAFLSFEKSNKKAYNFIESSVKYEYHLFTKLSPSSDINPLIYLLKSYFDINIIPYQEILKNLADKIKLAAYFHVEDQISSLLIIEKLEELSHNYDLYYEYILKPKRTFFEVLREFSIFVDIDFLIENIPRINYRYFTLINNNNNFSINISLINLKTSIKSPRKGLCSEYLKSIEKGKLSHFKIGKSQLCFNKNKYIFICTGSGIGLPYSVLNYFSGKYILIFYGFRNAAIDQLYKEIQMNKNYNNNTVKIFIAPSREDPYLYVQDVFMQNAPENIDEYNVFVSGNSRLNKEMRQTFYNIYHKNVRYQSETW